MIKTGTKTVSYLIIAAFVVSYVSFALHLTAGTTDYSDKSADTQSHCECAHEHASLPVNKVSKTSQTALSTSQAPAEHHHCICTVFDFQESDPLRRTTTASISSVTGSHSFPSTFQGFYHAAPLTNIYSPPDKREILSPQLSFLSKVIITC